MSTSDKIRELCEKQNISISDLARKNWAISAEF